MNFATPLLKRDLRNQITKDFVKVRIASKVGVAAKTVYIDAFSISLFSIYIFEFKYSRRRSVLLLIVDAETHPLAMKQNGEVEDSCSPTTFLHQPNGIDTSVIIPGAQAQNICGEVLRKLQKSIPGN